MLLLAVMLLVSGCTTRSSEITPLEKAGKTAGETFGKSDDKTDEEDAGETGGKTDKETVEKPGEKADKETSGKKNEQSSEAADGSMPGIGDLFTDGKMELPESGMVSQEQMEAIAGTDAVYQFCSVDKQMDISYSWSYEGKKIQNPVEQNLKVVFTEDKVEEVKKAANDASVGLGLTLEKVNLAAPAKLTVELSETWDADTVILCKLVDGVPEKMCDVAIGKTASGNTELTFSVIEMGDTYYLVGGNAGSQEGEAAAGETVEVKGTSHTCTISIECSTILDNMDDLKKSKKDFVPSDGWILYASEVEYTPGETVYDVLYRVCRETDIHMEASYTPAYSSYYVEGINQLYEFDCGSLSGWMYSVNGWFPNYGCSKYEVSDGDVIEWKYTCDLGRDVGDQYYED